MRAILGPFAYIGSLCTGLWGSGVFIFWFVFLAERISLRLPIHRSIPLHPMYFKLKNSVTKRTFSKKYFFFCPTKSLITSVS